MIASSSQVNSEVLNMINHIPIRDYIKIPPEVVQNIENNISNEYIEADTYSREAYVLFLKLYLTYIADEKEKQNVERLLKFNENKNEKIKQIKYSQDDLFKDTEIDNKQTKEITIINNKKWYQKIIDKIKNFFNVS